MMALDQPVAPPSKFPSSKLSALVPCLTREPPKLQVKTVIHTTASPATVVSTATGPAHEHSLLYPAVAYDEICSGVRVITAKELSLAVQRASQLPLPDSSIMFPWLHGVDPENESQLKHFKLNSIEQLSTPSTYRGITFVHSEAEDGAGRLIGSLSSNDILDIDEALHFAKFKQVDPAPVLAGSNINLRNFGIQARKLAFLSDVIVYHPRLGGLESAATLRLARSVSNAQRLFRSSQDNAFPIYNTFVVRDEFEVFEQKFPHLVADACLSNRSDTDLLKLEQSEMQRFTSATEIAENVYMGNIYDWTLRSQNASSDGLNFDLHIRCDGSSDKTNDSIDFENIDGAEVTEVSFPPAGSLKEDFVKKRQLVALCAWIYRQANPARAANAFGITAKPRKILLSCHDGYTETSLLALAYLMYVKGMTMEETWIYLHKAKKRDFHPEKADVAILECCAAELLRASPAANKSEANVVCSWLTRFNIFSTRSRGSLPSRILDHLYLGNIDHANNVDMLLALGIDRVLSVGERPDWTLPTFMGHQETRVESVFIDNIVDDGISSITPHIQSSLDFIDRNLSQGRKTLVHCQVGVSRSASICIAEVIRRLGMAVENAYIYVRARRLNVIIQPNLRLMYELLCWSQEEHTRRMQHSDTKVVLKAPRTIEWPIMASKIHSLNQLYLGPTTQ